MKLFFILYQISLFIITKEGFQIITDILFDQIKENDVKLILKDSKEEENNFYYRGNVKAISEFEKNQDYKTNSAVFVEDFKIDEIIKFPESTIFILKNNYSKDKPNINKYTFIIVNSFDFPIKKSHYYILISKDLNKTIRHSTIYCLVLFSLFLIILISSYNCCSCNFYNILVRIYTNIIANNNICFSLILIIFCVVMQFVYFFCISYSLYKGYFIIQLCYLLNGQSIIYSERINNKKLKYTVIIGIIEFILSLIFLYMVFFFPFLDNFYFFFVKSLIEHLAILAFAGKMFLEKFMRLYRQYRVERRIRTLLTLMYKYKLLLYSRVIIFSLFYGLGFIALNLFQIIYKINQCSYGFLYIYCMNVALEAFFCIIFGIIFYPVRNPRFLNNNNININFDLIYNNITFIAQIKNKKEKSMKINNLTEKTLKNEYLKKEYPVVLIEPFAKTDNLFNEKNFHIGVVKKF